MKVTKLIREYVAEQVMAKYPETESEKLYKEKLDKIQNKTDELNKQIKEYALKLCKQANEDLGIDVWADKNDKIHLSSCYNVVSSGSYNNPYAINLQILKNDRNKKINDTIKNILVNLELGATKAELDEMLKNLKQQEGISPPFFMPSQFDCSTPDASSRIWRNQQLTQFFRKKLV